MSDTATSVRAAQLARALVLARREVAALQKQLRAMDAKIQVAPPVARQRMLNERKPLALKLAQAQARVSELETKIQAVKRQGKQNALQQQAAGAAAAKAAEEERKRRRKQAKLRRQAERRSGQQASDFVASPPETRASTGIRAIDLVPVYQRWLAQVRPVAERIMINQRVMPRVAVAKAFDRLNVPVRLRDRMRDELLAALRPLWRPQAFRPSAQSAPPVQAPNYLPAPPVYMPAPPVYMPQPPPPPPPPQLPVYMPGAQGVNPYQSGAFNPFPFSSSVQQGGAPSELEHQQYPEELTDEALGPDGQPLEAGADAEASLEDETPWWKKPWVIAATVAAGYVGWRYYKKSKKGAPAAAK